MFRSPRSAQRSITTNRYGEDRADPVEVPDFLATLYHKLGIDHTKEYVSNIGRPVKLSDGQPLKFL